MAQRRKHAKEQKFNEQQFQDWFRAVTQHFRLNPDPDDPGSDYDYRGAYRAGIRGPGPRHHWDSTFKRGGHPREVVGGFHTQLPHRRDPKSSMASSELELMDLGFDPDTARDLARTHGLERLPPQGEIKFRRRKYSPDWRSRVRGSRIEDVK